MRRLALVAGAWLAAFATPLAAQAPAPTVTETPPDPARLAAARALVEAAMPAAQRQTMMQAIMRPMMANIQSAFASNPDFQKALGDDPRVAALFDKFMKRTVDDTLASLNNAMPGLMDAMASAYARQFSVAELNEVRAFYLTPTGRTFMAKLPAVMGDPAIARAQQAMMKDQMARIPAAAAELKAEIAKLKAEPK